ncbi:snaclec coagulation factor IX/factor X-binding protein subunit B-like [Asterias amurensis]|uniref:snaclec coagulation factor IX/factor X-binding protein subunit B-like n=1 Tax=Asterias amurensis TaxID=7602 RepID=UPI003AB77F91
MAANFTVFSFLLALLQSYFLIVSPACLSCHSPWTSFGNHCYLLVMDAKRFDEAEQHCQILSRLGRPSYLASIMSQDENDFLVLLIKSVYGETGKRTWFGYRLDRSSNSSTWGFIDGSSSGGYTNWHGNQPDGDGDCVEFFASAKNFLWNDLHCSYKRSFICKRPARF